ncbi:MAG: c-type cytochrome [Aestuariivirgaceae bacterium]
MTDLGRNGIVAVALVIALGLGVATGYALWGREPDWYASHDADKLPPGQENDLIRFGRDLVVNTAKIIGPQASDPQRRFAGNNLSCTNCHINAGLEPFAAPFVSTFTSYPLVVDDRFLTLVERINGCMRRSMNGKALPDRGREMDAIVSYIKFVGTGAPQDVRVAGMGLRTLKPPKEPPSADRGQAVYASACAECHGSDGLGQRRPAPEPGYLVPPVWGDDSFNSAAGMAQPPIAAAFIRAKMPYYARPALTRQEAWDVAQLLAAKPRPQRLAEP